MNFNASGRTAFPWWKLIVLLVIVCGFISCEEFGLSKPERADQGSSILQVAAPIFSPGTGSFAEDQLVSLSCGTIGATIYYTLDGSLPGIESPVYSEPIPVVGNGAHTRILALATKQGMYDSPIREAVITVDRQRVSTPQIILPPGPAVIGDRIEFFCSTEDVSFHYTTDGSDPDDQSPAESFHTIEAPVTLKVVALKAGLEPSTVAVETISVRLPLPVLDPPAGTVMGGETILFVSSVPDVFFYYTQDGSIPLSTSSYGASFTLDAPVTLRVIARKAGWHDSLAQVASYIPKVATPSISPGGGIVSPSTLLVFSCATPGVSYRYTTDGTAPMASSPSAGSHSVTSSPLSLRLMATKTGWAASDIAAFSYTVPAPEYPPYDVSVVVTSSWYKTPSYGDPTRGWRHSFQFSLTPPVGGGASWYEMEVRVEGSWKHFKNTSFTNFNAWSYYYNDGPYSTTSYLLDAPEPYTFRVRSANPGGVSPWTEFSLRLPLGMPGLSSPSYQPGAPYNSNLEIWELSDGANGYSVERRFGITGLWTETALVPLSNRVMGATDFKISYADPKPNNNSRYYYRVRAYRIIEGIPEYSPYSSIIPGN